MKLARVLLAVVMLVAMVFKTLPDSLFDYFHTHSHVSHDDRENTTQHIIEDYKHNCHIPDSYFQAFEVYNETFQFAKNETKTVFIQRQPPLAFTSKNAAIGRGPPIA